MDSDYDNLIKKHHELIEIGSDALDDMLKLAREQEHPRSYEVFGKLLKDLSDMNQNLMDVKKKNKELKSDSPKGVRTNNNVLIASTEDVQRMLGKNTIKDIIGAVDSGSEK